jgi:hypothetical protein
MVSVIQKDKWGFELVNFAAVIWIWNCVSRIMGRA